MNGAIHVHSTYSDGEFTLRELRDVYLAAGCSFACMTDHAENFDQGQLRAYVAECEALSDDDFHLLPGLEYTCDRRLHVLGYGVTTLAGTTDPQAVIRHIERAGGIAVIAHPTESTFPWIETFATLPHGVETWNSKYDGRYAPRPSTFALLGRLRARRPGMSAYYGQDLHWRRQYRGLLTVIRNGSLSTDAILQTLAAGGYHGLKGELVLPADGVLPEPLLQRFDRLARHSTRIRTWIKRIHRISGRLGVNLPAGIKRELRRII